MDKETAQTMIDSAPSVLDLMFTKEDAPYKHMMDDLRPFMGMEDILMVLLATFVIKDRNRIEMEQKVLQKLETAMAAAEAAESMVH